MQFRSFVFAILSFSVLSAHAQYGIGLTPATSCPGGYGPAASVVDPTGIIQNEKGRYDSDEAKIKALEQREKGIDDEVNYAKDRIGEVITPLGLQAIEEHREHHNSYASYRKACGGGPATARPETGTDPAVFGSPGRSYEVDTTITQVPPPEGFCIINPATGQRANVWEKFVEDDGTVSDKICNFRISGIAREADAHKRGLCRQGMHDYYDRMAERSQAEKEIAKLEEDAKDLARDLKRVSDEITDGTWCPWCDAQRRGYSNAGVMPSVQQNTAILQGFGPQYGQPPPAIIGGPAAYGGPGYPVNTYQSTIPGYYNLSGPPGGVQYGGVPGGIGAGGFGCSGANPLAQNTNFASPNQIPIFGQQSPVNNIFANPQIGPAYNQGAGPWGFPNNANGFPAFNNYGQPVNAWPAQSQFGGLRPSPFMSAYGAPQSYFGSPQAYYAGQPGYYGGQPGGAYSPLGLNYGSLVGPGYGTPMWAGLYGGVPGYGQTALGVGGYYGQVGQLTNRLQLINTGSVYGGGYAPVPYLTTPVTPVQGGRPPSILPYQ